MLSRVSRESRQGLDDINSAASLFWEKMRTHIKRLVHCCKLCQTLKLTGVKKYGKIPLLLMEFTEGDPWKYIQIDCAGPCKVEFHETTTGRTLIKSINLFTILEQCLNWLELSTFESTTMKIAAD